FFRRDSQSSRYATDAYPEYRLESFRDEKTLRLLAVTVAKGPATLNYADMPFYCHTHEPVYFTRDKKRERFENLVRWWNDAPKLAIEYYPDATHFFDVGTYYLGQTRSLRQLVLRYERLQ